MPRTKCCWGYPRVENQGHEKISTLLGAMSAVGLHYIAATIRGRHPSVRSYDRATGDYVLELRNETTRPVLYLNPYLNFDTVRRPEPEPFPESPEGMALMVHSTKLAPGGSVVLSGRCTAGGLCSRPETYVAVRACWFAKMWTCEQYFPIWSKTPLTGV